MDSEAAPIIRLQVEQMKASILHHMGLHGSELGDLIDKEVMEAIDRYPWEEQVRKVVHAAIDEQIERYFKYGTGSKAIYNVLDEAIKGLDDEN